MSTDCIFCKIINQEIPSYTIYEDDHVLAFLDINPSTDGHTLIIPKEHHANMMETPPELLDKILIVAQKIAPAIMKSVNAPAFNFSNNCGSAAGQIIFHTHFHILPRKAGDGKQMWGHREASPEELNELLEKIKKNL